MLHGVLKSMALKIIFFSEKKNDESCILPGLSFLGGGNIYGGSILGATTVSLSSTLTSG